MYFFLGIHFFFYGYFFPLPDLFSGLRFLRESRPRAWDPCFPGLLLGTLRDLRVSAYPIPDCGSPSIALGLSVNLARGTSSRRSEQNYVVRDQNFIVEWPMSYLHKVVK